MFADSKAIKFVADSSACGLRSQAGHGPGRPELHRKLESYTQGIRARLGDQASSWMDAVRGRVAIHIYSTQNVASEDGQMLNRVCCR